MTTHRNRLTHKGKITVYAQKEIILVEVKKKREIIKRIVNEFCYINQRVSLKS